jgi:hypothetical protein
MGFIDDKIGRIAERKNCGLDFGVRDSITPQVGWQYEANEAEPNTRRTPLSRTRIRVKMPIL